MKSKLGSALTFHRPLALWPAVLVLAFALAVPAGAAVITVSGTITATSASGGGADTIALGDVFDYSFTFDDTTIDSDVQTYNANFSTGVSAVSLQRRAGNTGTWNPASGTFNWINFVAGANSDSITLQLKGTGFPNVDGQSFFDVGLSFDWLSTTRNFVDTGSGQTFAQVVGTSPLNFSTADGSKYGEIRYGSSIYSLSSTNFSLSVNGAAVPEGSSLVPFVLALGVLGTARFRRR